MICILPEQQRAKDKVLAVDSTVAITSMHGFIEFGQRKKPIAFRPSGGSGLRRCVSKQLDPIVDHAVSIAIQS